MLVYVDPVCWMNLPSSRSARFSETSCRNRFSVSCCGWYVLVRRVEADVGVVHDRRGGRVVQHRLQRGVQVLEHQPLLARSPAAVSGVTLPIFRSSRRTASSRCGIPTGVPSPAARKAACSAAFLMLPPDSRKSRARQVQVDLGGQRRAGAG